MKCLCYNKLYYFNCSYIEQFKRFFLYNTEWPVCIFVYPVEYEKKSEGCYFLLFFQLACNLFFLQFIPNNTKLPRQKSKNKDGTNFSTRFYDLLTNWTKTMFMKYRDLKFSQILNPRVNVQNGKKNTTQF